jgi:Mannosyltransferase (PIG-V)
MPQLWRVVAVFLGWRIALLLAFMATASMFTPQPFGPAIAGEEPQIVALSRVPLWQSGTFNWDGTHYLRLAAHGYRAGEHDGFRFFPLFPIAVSALHSLGLGLVAAGILLNGAAGGVAAVVLYLLAIDYCHDRARAERAFLLFLLFPSSYFLAAYYTEALFCALGFAAFLLARRRQWLAAGVLLGLMTATRPTAFCFASAIFAEYLSWKRFSWRAIDRQILNVRARTPGTPGTHDLSALSLGRRPTLPSHAATFPAHPFQPQPDSTAMEHGDVRGYRGTLWSMGRGDLCVDRARMHDGGGNCSHPYGTAYAAQLHGATWRQPARLALQWHPGVIQSVRVAAVSALPDPGGRIVHVPVPCLADRVGGADDISSLRVCSEHHVHRLNRPPCYRWRLPGR